MEPYVCCPDTGDWGRSIGDGQAFACGDSLTTGPFGIACPPSETVCPDLENSRKLCERQDGIFNDTSCECKRLPRWHCRMETPQGTDSGSVSPLFLEETCNAACEAGQELKLRCCHPAETGDKSPGACTWKASLPNSECPASRPQCDRDHCAEPMSKKQCKKSCLGERLRFERLLRRDENNCKNVCVCGCHSKPSCRKHCKAAKRDRSSSIIWRLDGCACECDGGR